MRLQSTAAVSLQPGKRSLLLAAARKPMATIGAGRSPKERPAAASHPTAGTAPAEGAHSMFPSYQRAASLSFFNARVLILTVAGLAAKTRSCFVKGSMPVRFFLAGTLVTLTFNSPGSVNEPSPFL